MTLDEIRQLIQAVVDSGVAELEVQRGDNRVKIRRTARVSVSRHDFVAPSASAAVAETHYAPAPTPAAAPTTPAQAPGPASTEPADVMSDPSLIIIKSPIVGTYYESPSPGSAAFIRIGDTVQPGKVLCIIESMKLMNEIEAETAGVIVSKLVENGHPVEYGEALFALRPL